MLANVRTNKGLAVSHFIKNPNYILRHDLVATRVTVSGPETVLFTPTVDGLPPCPQSFLIRLDVHLVQHLNHIYQHRLHRPNQWHLDVTHCFLDRCRVNIDVYDPRIWTEFFRIVRHSVIKTSADRKNHVCLMHCLVCFIKAMHSKHSNKLVVGPGKCPETHQSIRHWISEPSGESGQLLCGVTQDHTATRVDDRPLSLQQKIQRFTDLTRMALKGRCVRTELDGFWILKWAFFLWRCHIFWNVHNDGARAARLGDVESFFHDTGYLFD